MEEEELMMWKSEPGVDTMLSATVGRVMATLLGARPRKLEDAISRLSSASKRASLVSLDESLWFLHNYVRDAAEKGEPLDNVLVPMIEHSLKCKESKHGYQALILFSWLFQDELLFQAVATNLANIIFKKEDHYIALGWSTFVRGLLEYEDAISQFVKNGIREKYNALLMVLCPCIPHLVFIVCKGSTLLDGYELPTRLSVAAADCLLALTVSLVKNPQSSGLLSNKSKSSNSSGADRLVSLISDDIDHKKVKPTVKFPEVSNCKKMESLLWNHMNELILLLQKLLAWSRKSRSLHVKGVLQVLKWLQEIKGQYGCSQDEAGCRNFSTGILLLSSCWKHYGLLLRLEDHRFSQRYRELLDQYLSGIQFYTETCHEERMNKDSGIETRKFFLNCVALLLGRFDNKQFESTISEYGFQMSHILVSQLHCGDEDVIDVAVCIFKEVIFKMKISSSGSSLSETKHIDAVLPLLLNLLDERDGTARAVVMLIAECCSTSRGGHCLQEILKRLTSGNVLQRRNAVDVLSELICRSSRSENALSHSLWRDIAIHLLECVGDEEYAIRMEVSKLLPMIEPSLVLPALVKLAYSSFQRVQSHASDALIAVLKYHNEEHKVLCMLLDCLSNLCESQVLQKTSGEKREGSKLDTDRVLRLIPEWSKAVKDWSMLIGPLIDRMFAEPSNATVVRFLSYISEHLAEAADLVFQRILLHTEGQEEIDESFFSGCENKTYTSDDSVKLQHLLFNRLCPLLIIRLLPLRVFDDVNSSIVYGHLPGKGIKSDNDYFIINDKCVAAFLLNRACCKIEFEDVRKLAAELCGRIHPKVLFPVISSQLDHATISQDTLKIKACLFSVCTSLVIRGRDSVLHLGMLKIREAIKTILLWPSIDGEEVSKAQHGCIDCLALMICTELQVPEIVENPTFNKISIDGKATSRNPTINYVIYQLTHDKTESASISKLDDKNCMYEASVSLSFRLCMANVLISTCQKISDSSKIPFAQRTLPQLIHSVQVITDSEIRSACIQVLFSAVYHLKSAVLPYSPDLLELSLKSLRKGPEKERMAGAKLMASLMASEDAVLESISGGLLEARTVLSKSSTSDPSMPIQEFCRKLLECTISSQT